MGLQKNATYKVHNGVDFDEIYFKTIASQVFFENGINFEKGFQNNKENNGYTQLPNGLLLQWGSINIPLHAIGISGSAEITFPLSFPTKILASSATCVRNGGWNNGNSVGVVSASIYPKNNGSATVMAVPIIQLSQEMSMTIDWIAIGC